MPRAKKPPGTAVDARNGMQVPIKGSALLLTKDTTPIPPRGLLELSEQIWDAYWDDPDSPARVLTPADTFPAMRWIDAVDRYLRFMAAADERPLVKGSTGQDVRNPLYDLATRALSVAEQCERQLGIGPLNRMNLGIQVVAAQRSLAQMNAEVDGGKDAGPDAEESDPRRLRAVPGARR